MRNRLNQTVRASALAEELSLDLEGPDLELIQVCPLNDLQANALTFSRRGDPLSVKAPLLVIGPGRLAGGVISVLESANPRLDFIRALRFLDQTIGFVHSSTPPKIHPSARIGENAVIENGVEIGEQTVIYHNVVIGEGVVIGKGCLVKSGAVIGEEGFGFERDTAGVPVRMPQLGSVVIGDDVEIGSQSTICRGSLQNTVVEDHVKIDDHVHIGHNCLVESNVIITACVELSGGVRVGKGAWIAPNAAVLQKIRIGEEAVVGIGAAVVRDIEDSATVFGYPARPLPMPAK